MSIIGGAIHFGGAAVDSPHLEAVLQAYAHLGPDGGNTWTQGSVGLLHWMRHGTPQSRNERLPLAIQTGGLAITAESRLDNRDELYDALCVEPLERAAISDSVLILRAYQKWGENCPEHLEGDFSFAVYDHRQGSLVCVQSAYPVQPLYYLQSSSCFAFASLIRPLLSIARAPKRLNEEFFSRHVAMARLRPNFDPAERFETAFAGVRALPPASIMTINRDGFSRLRTWWRPDSTCEIHQASDQDHYDRLREVTIRVVHDRMRTHQRIVACLSGGLDSSSIACIAARKLRERGQQLTALSSVLPLDHVGPEKDERQFIDIVKNAADLDVKYIYPRYSIADHDDRYTDWRESPRMTDKGYVFRAFYDAAESCGAGVILDGCGGEYGPTNHGFNVLAHLARQGQWLHVGRELHAMSRVTGLSSISLLLTQVVAPNFPGLHSLYRRFKYSSEKKDAVEIPLSQEFVQRHKGRVWISCEDARRVSIADPRQIMAFGAARVQGRCSNLASRAHGIRTVFPFLDRRIVDCCLAVPARLYQVNGWQRNLIRQSMQGILPPEIQWRNDKAPFSPDFYRQFQTQRVVLRNEFASIASGDIARTYYDIEQIIRIIDDLADRPGRENSPEGTRIKLCVQSSLAGIRFLRWFERVNVDVAPLRRVA